MGGTFVDPGGIAFWDKTTADAGPETFLFGAFIEVTNPLNLLPPNSSAFVV